MTRDAKSTHSTGLKIGIKTDRFSGCATDIAGRTYALRALPIGARKRPIARPPGAPGVFVKPVPGAPGIL